MEDKLLVLKCKRGSPDALVRIYRKYKADLLVLAMALLNDKSVAEDVVHDVFLSFVDSLDKFRLSGTLKGFLLTCVANRARNINKAKHHLNADLEAAASLGSHSDDPTNSMICNEQLKKLSSAMARLPYEQREIVMLHHQAAMTFNTIAKSLGISTNTTKSRYRYGLNKLRLILDDEVKK